MEYLFYQTVSTLITNRRTDSVLLPEHKKGFHLWRALKNIPYFDQDFFLDNKKTLITGFKNIRCKRFSFYNCFLFEAICVDF